MLRFPVRTAIENVGLPLKLTNLNSKERMEHAVTAQEVRKMLSRLNQEYGKTIVMVTHDPHAAKTASHIRYLEKGELLPEGQAPEDWGSPITPQGNT